MEIITLTPAQYEEELEYLRSAFRMAKRGGWHATMEDCKLAHKSLGKRWVRDVLHEMWQARYAAYLKELAVWYAKWDDAIKAAAPTPVCPLTIPGCPDFPT